MSTYRNTHRYFSALAVAVLLLATLACGKTTPTSEPVVSTTAPEARPTQAPSEEATSTPAPVEAPTDTPEQPPTPVVRERIIFYAGSGLGMQKLQGVAFENGISFTLCGGNDFFTELNEPDVAAAIYGGIGGTYIDRGEFEALSDFVAGGGRVLILYDYNWAQAQANEKLQALFNVFVIEERVAGSEEITGLRRFVYDEAMLPHWLSGLTVGVEGNDGITLSAYLVTPSSSSESGYLISLESEKERLVYYSNPDRSVTFFPRLGIGFHRYTRYFFGDDNFDLFDNERAALAMLQYLLGE